jgi:hypothetical protein
MKKKLILIISIFISWIYLANFINAITVTKNSWEVLDNTTWTNISNLTNKIDVSSSDIKLNWKLYVTWKLCDNSWKCLWDIEYGTAAVPWKSCLDIKSKWITKDWIYHIKPDANPAFEVYCNMTFGDWWWTLIHVSEEANSRWKFKWDGSCAQLNKDCNYKVNNTLVDTSNKVLFYTDSNYYAKLDYINTWKWALTMKDDVSRWAWWHNAWLTLKDKWASVSRDTYWNRFRDNSKWLIFCENNYYWVMTLSYWWTNGWMQNNNAWWNTHTINVFIK